MFIGVFKLFTGFRKTINLLDIIKMYDILYISTIKRYYHRFSKKISKNYKKKNIQTYITFIKNIQKKQIKLSS